MDRTIQLKTLIITTLLMLLFMDIFGQAPACDSTEIRVVQVGACPRVQMSIEMFTKFYLYKVNLEKISNELPVLQGDIDSLKIVQNQIDSTYQREINLLVEQKVLINDNLNQCMTTASSLDQENQRLARQNVTLRKRGKIMFAAGFTTAVMGYVAIKIF